MCLGNPRFDRCFVGRASRLPSKNYPPPAGRPRYILKVRKNRIGYDSATKNP
jgi:hypothetical protein